MEFHPIIDGPIEFLVAPANHPKGKGGAHACDIRCTPGTNVYAPCDGTAAHFYEDSFDGAPIGGAFFNFKFPPAQKGDPADKFYIAHVKAATPNVRKYKKGELLGTATGEFIHVGANHKTTLDGLITA